MDYMEDELEFDEIHSNVIPALDGHRVAHVDAFGNVQTTLRVEDLKGVAQHKQQVSLQIGGKKFEATYLPHRYMSDRDTLVISPSSTGHPDNPYLELSVWVDNPTDQNKSACARLHHPRPEDRIEVESRK